VNVTTIQRMVKVLYYFNTQEFVTSLMVTHMKEIGLMVKCMEKEYTIILMEISIEDIGEMIRRKATVLVKYKMYRSVYLLQWGQI